MKIYEHEFMVLYQYYLKYGGGGTEIAIENAKNVLGYINGLFSFGLTILFAGIIFGTAPNYIVEIIFSEYKAMPLVFILFICINILNRITWKRLNFNKLCEKSKNVKTRIWWLMIFSGIFALLSIVLVPPISSLSKALLQIF